MNPLYDHLKKNKIKKISCHALSRWATRYIDELIQKKRLKKAENNRRIYCDSCSESCPIDDYDIIELPDQGKKAVFVCPEKEDMGLITVSLSRRRQWSFVPLRQHKKKQKTVTAFTTTKPSPAVEDAFFVYLEDRRLSKNPRDQSLTPGIGFFYDKELKILPFKHHSQALRVLPKLIDGSLTSEEVQQYAGSADKARSIVKNINKSILSRLHKADLTQISQKKFIRYDQQRHSYSIHPQIISQNKYKELLEICKVDS